MTKLLVGLGNPEIQYFETNTMLVFMLIRSTSEQNVTFTHDKIFQTDLASFFPKWRKIYLVQTNDLIDRKWKSSSCFINLLWFGY